jgi:hypothetical protein
MASGLAFLRALLVLATLLWPAATLVPAGELGPLATEMASGAACGDCGAINDGVGPRCPLPCAAAGPAVAATSPEIAMPHRATFAVAGASPLAGRFPAPEPGPPRAGTPPTSIG